MRVLVDTHALVWWAQDSPRLSKRARTLLAAGSSEVLWSVASSWELAIKHSLGRMELATTLSDFLDVELPRQGIEILPIDHRHIVRVAELPLHHRDPFDRMLVAQAQIEGVALVSADQHVRRYDLKVIW